MSRYIKKLPIILFFLCLLVIGPNKMEANFPTIFYTNGTPGINYILIDASINANNDSATAWVEYDTLGNLINSRETNHIIISPTNHENVVFINVENLLPDTLYYLRVVVDNGENIENTVRSSIVAVRTLPGVNSIQNQTTTQITNTNTQNNTQNTTTNTEVSSVQDTNKTVSKSDLDLTANAIFYPYFLPKTVPNWIAFIVVLIIIPILLGKLYLDEKNQ